MGKLEETLDHKWEMQFFELKKFNKKYGHCDVPQNTTPYIKLAVWCVWQRKWKKFRPLEYDPDRIRKLESIGFSWSIHDKWFEKNFKKLQAYMLRYGHSCIFSSIDKSLSKWCGHLREDKMNKAERLTSERIKRLDSIGFDWEPDENLYDNLHFEERLAQLKEFVLKHKRYPLDSDKKYPFLATWVERQRHDKRYNTLSKERIGKLDAFEFRWDPNKENWENNFEELKIFKAKYGHCNVPQSQINKKHYILSNWCNRQRKLYKEKNNSLADEQIQKLNSIGFKWVYPFKPGELVRNRTSEETLLNELKRLKKKLGRTPTLKDLKQYSKYKKGQYELRFGNFGNAITKAGIQKKEEEFWLHKFNELKIFIKKYNRNPTRTESEFESLALWILNQRQLKKREQLSGQRIKLLDSIKFQWNPHKNSWDINFENLKAYKKKFGHCNIPENPGPYEKLGAWLGNQRRNYTRNNNWLSEERAEKLNSIGVSWKSVYKPE